MRECECRRVNCMVNICQLDWTCLLRKPHWSCILHNTDCCSKSNKHGKATSTGDLASKSLGILYQKSMSTRCVSAKQEVNSPSSRLSLADGTSHHRFKARGLKVGSLGCFMSMLQWTRNWMAVSNYRHLHLSLLYGYYCTMDSNCQLNCTCLLRKPHWACTLHNTDCCWKSISVVIGKLVLVILPLKNWKYGKNPCPRAPRQRNGSKQPLFTPKSRGRHVSPQVQGARFESWQARVFYVHVTMNQELDGR